MSLCAVRRMIHLYEARDFQDLKGRAAGKGLGQYPSLLPTSVWKSRVCVSRKTVYRCCSFTKPQVRPSHNFLYFLQKQLPSISPSNSATFYFPLIITQKRLPVQRCILGSVNATGNAVLCGRGEQRQSEPVWSVLGIVVFFVHAFV